jgi:hypothetical protein
MSSTSELWDKVQGLADDMSVDQVDDLLDMVADRGLVLIRADRVRALLNAASEAEASTAADAVLADFTEQYAR